MGDINIDLLNDFNIDLLKHDSIESIGDFYNIMTPHFFAPYVIQPTRLISKTLIDNIFINSIEYSSYSGNITIQLSDHLFQFVILEGFFKDLLRKRLNIYERNFKHFNEREFGDELNSMDLDSILSIERNDPNISIGNFHNNIIYILDEFSPFKNLTKKEYKLKTKPWIDREILNKIYEKHKLMNRYCKCKDQSKRQIIYEEYKPIRNCLTQMKREAKIKYYQEYLEKHKSKSSYIWKGIKSIVKLNTSSKKDINLIDEKGIRFRIANVFNKYFVNIGLSIDKSIPKAKTDFRNYLKNIKVNITFFISHHS